MDMSSSGDFIRAIKREPENFYLIHYSCQSLYDDNDSLSPRITSIAISHFATEQIVSFSTHAIAEELGVPRSDVRQRFDQVELELLTRFYAFVRERRDRYWVHWNMRNLTYGFEHLEHRYRALGKFDASVIPVERRINLNDILSDRYGSDYAPHPKLTGLMELNGGLHRHFLSGEQEVQAFKNDEFIRMHNSTLCKVGFFHQVIKKMRTGKLKTQASGLGVMLDRLFESRGAKGFSFVATLLAFVAAAWESIQYVRHFL